MYEQYLLKRGEDLGTVANKFHIDSNILKELNNIEYDEELKVGQELVVPKINNNFYSYIIVNIEGTVKEIAHELEIDANILASINGLDLDDYIYLGQQIIIPKEDYRYYVTKIGDTLTGVADIFSINNETLITNNQTLYLQEGQIIVSKK